MMTNILLLPLMAYAAVGLVLSLTVHLLSYLGLQPAGNGLFYALHIGIFPLWIPVVLIVGKMSGGMRWGGGRSWGTWNAVLAEAPTWMKYMTWGFFAYAMVNFILFMLLMVFASPGHVPRGGEPPSFVWRGFSGHWMAFYSAGLAVLTAAWRRGLSNLERRCANGHVVAIGDRFCPTCGSPVEKVPALVADRAVNV
jgi:hypothetical protein